MSVRSTSAIRIPEDERRSRLCPKSCCTYTSLQNQTLPSQGPVVFAPKHYFLCLGVTSLICVIIAIIVAADSFGLKSQKIRWDDVTDCKVLSTHTASDLPKTCTVTMTLEEDMTTPIFVWYHYTNFNQNHRRYHKSMSMAQLVEGLPTDEGLCNPGAVTKYNDGSGEKMIYPCGMLPYTFPPDRITAKHNAENLCSTCLSADARSADSEWHADKTWDKENICFDVDKESKFTVITDTTGTTRRAPIWDTVYDRDLPPVTDEDLMVWMRSAALPNFRKLYRVISDRNMKKGDTLEFTIYNFFDAGTYDNEKWIIIGTVGMLGAQNAFLFAMALVTALLCVAFGVSIFVQEKMALAAQPKVRDENDDRLEAEEEKATI